MSRSTDNPWLHRFACLTAAATLGLVCVGGLVTSKGAGMAVPDWPTTYGYNMFFFPISKWVGGVFYEHTHRLLAFAAGFLTLILAVWLWVKDERVWIRWLGVSAVLAVVLQAVLGGLRVILLNDQIGIFHAALAQIFLTMTCALALFTSRWWHSLPVGSIADHAGLRGLLGLTTLLVFLQLLMGATMRHQHAGLAIPDFPLAYHKLWPPMDPASVASYNQARPELVSLNPITAFQIGLQMAHRIAAGLIFGMVAFCAWKTRRSLGARHPLARLSLVWLVLILAQVFLGAFTIWSDKAADIATAHVAVGALALVTGAMLTTIAFRVLIPALAPAPATAGSAATGLPTGKPAASGAK
jgi:cytochrome c oxidase assembly protein subunit 15